MNLRDFFIISTWWGKILGAFFGYLSAGSLGAIFGLIVGNFFDRGLVSLYSNPHWLYHAEKHKAIQKMFFETTFLMMGYVAKSDGRVSKQEIEMAKLLMNEMKLNKVQIALAKRLFNEGKQAQFAIATTLNQLQRACKDNRNLLKLFIDIQYRAALVDGLNAKKIQALDLILTTLGFAPLNRQNRFYEDFGRTYQHYQTKDTGQKHQHGSYNYETSQSQTQSNPLSQAYALLEINADASKQEVRKAYRRLLSQNHPDKLIAKGLPDEMIKLANDKTHCIRQAYELICKTKGW